MFNMPLEVQAAAKASLLNPQPSIHESLQASSNTVDGVASCLNAATKIPTPTHRITLAIHARTIQFGAEGAHDVLFTTPISCN